MDRRERANDLQIAMLAVLEGFEAGVWTALPAIVQSFDPVAMTAVMQPAIQAQVRKPDGTQQWVSLPLMPDVPVCFPGGGGFTLTFPVAAGDEALVIIASRCIDAWWAYGGVQIQQELRMHDLSDGFALVGVRSRPRALAGVSTNSTVLRNDAGTTLVEVSATKVRIEADEVEIFGRNKTTFDAGGTGFVYTPAQIDTYTTGVTVVPHPPSPPEIP